MPTVITAFLALAGLLVLVFAEPLRSEFLDVAARFDKDGVVSNPQWLYRPVVTVAGILLLYALLRAVFERRAGHSLESWIIAGAGFRHVRYPAMVGAFIAIPAIFAAFVYAVTHQRFWALYYSEDQLFENVTAVLLLAGGGLMVVAAANFVGSSLPWRLAGASIIAAMGAASILLGLEEISYGQRLFGWDTPPGMQDANIQSETNLHNYWTHDVQANLWWMMAAAMLLGISASAILRRFWRNPWIAILPDQALLPYGAALVLLASHAGFHEPLEQAVALFAALYGYQVAAAAYRNRNTDLQGSSVGVIP